MSRSNLQFRGKRVIGLASFDFRGCTAQASMFQLLAGHGWM